MNDTLNKVYWSVGTVIVSLALVWAFNLGGAKSVTIGAIGAGITNFTGIGVDGTPGTIEQGGVVQTTIRQALVTTATTTPCAIAFPTASSTVDSASMVITTATSSSMYYVAGVTTQYATSSSMLSATNIAANATGIVVAYPSSGTGNTTANEYLTFGVGAGSPTYTNTSGVVVKGYCQAIFTSTN